MEFFVAWIYYFTQCVNVIYFHKCDKVRWRIFKHTRKIWRKLASLVWTASNMPSITAYVKVSYFWNNYITKLFVVLISWFSSPTLLTKISFFPAWVLFKGVQKFPKYTQPYKQSLLKGWKSLGVFQATTGANLRSNKPRMFLKAAIDQANSLYCISYISALMPLVKLTAFLTWRLVFFNQSLHQHLIDNHL